MRRAAACVVVGLASTALLTSSVGAGTRCRRRSGRREAPATDLEQQLADRFAPIVMLKAAGRGVRHRGGAVRAERRRHRARQSRDGLAPSRQRRPGRHAGPGATDLVGLGQGFFLDFPGSSLEPECIYERDFRKYSGDRPATVYAHVVQQPDRPDLVAVQYWFYWYYNDWNNKHESDWEGITLEFAASSVEEALASNRLRSGTPSTTAVSEPDGTTTSSNAMAIIPSCIRRPVTRQLLRRGAVPGARALARGSAATTRRSIAARRARGRRACPTRSTIRTIRSPGWSYDGRWGERQSGLVQHARRTRRQGTLVGSSSLVRRRCARRCVVIPTGDSQGGVCGVAVLRRGETGSTMLVTFTVSPARVLFMFVRVGLILLFVVRRTELGGSRSETPIQRRRKAGQIVRAATGSIARTAVLRLRGLRTRVLARGPRHERAGRARHTGPLLRCAQLARRHEQRYQSGPVTARRELHQPGGIRDRELHRRRLPRERMGTGSPMRSPQPEECGSGDTTSPAHSSGRSSSWRRCCSRSSERRGASGNSSATSSCRTSVGRGHLGGRAALDRSSSLVRGRWFHTAIVTALLNLMAGRGRALAVGIILLVGVAGLPIWVFSALATLVYVVIVPLAAISMTLLYGDAAVQGDEDNADQRDEDAADLVPAV